MFCPPKALWQKGPDMAKKKIIIDDGFNPEFVETAFFDGILEMPRIERPEIVVIPDAVIPFSQRDRSADCSEMLVFYEYDTDFGDILRNPQKYVDEVSRFAGMVTLDNSLYTDSPLQVQMSNVYRSRAIGHFFQKKASMWCQMSGGAMSAAIRHVYFLKNSHFWGCPVIAS